MFGLEHQSAGWTCTDAVSAIHARGLRQRNIAFRRDVGIEAATSYSDRKSVLSVGTAGFDAFIAEDALGVVAHIEVIVDLNGLVHVFGFTAVTVGAGVIPPHVGLRL